MKIEKSRYWKNCMLGEIIELTMGQSPKSEYYNTNGIGLPFLQGNKTFGFRYPTFEIYCNKSKKNAEKGDILMSVRAPVGDLNIAHEKIGIGRGLCSIRGKEYDNLFIYYLLKYNIENLKKKQSGTVFGGINKNDILSLKVFVPVDKVIREKITNILKNLDEKIELNNEINNNLLF